MYLATRYCENCRNMTLTSDTSAMRPTECTDELELCGFLGDYASLLFASGSTCIRLEKNVKRIAGAWGMTAEMSVFPRHIHLTVSSPDGLRQRTKVVAAPDGPVSFSINAALSRLSWDIHDCHLSLEAARRRLEAIRHTPPTNKWLLPVLVALANAGFCGIFHGDWVAMAVVAVATYFGFIVRQTMTEHKIDFRITVIVCSFVSAVLGAGDGLFHFGDTPDVAVSTSVLYLVPGIPFLNSFSDMIDRHYICSFGRLMNALVITACLSLGLLAGMMLMRLDMF